jgi:hypothetical protein
MRLTRHASMLSLQVLEGTVSTQSWSSLCLISYPIWSHLFPCFHPVSNPVSGRVLLVLELIPGSAVSREASFHSTPSRKRLGRDLAETGASRSVY